MVSERIKDGRAFLKPETKRLCWRLSISMLMIQVVT